MTPAPAASTFPAGLVPRAQLDIDMARERKTAYVFPYQRVEEGLIYLALQEKAEERVWEVDWDFVHKQTRLAEELEDAGNLPDAFAALCRAMLPLSAALARVRNKEEDFNPKWERPT